MNVYRIIYELVVNIRIHVQELACTPPEFFGNHVNRLYEITISDVLVRAYTSRISPGFLHQQCKAAGGQNLLLLHLTAAPKTDVDVIEKIKYTYMFCIHTAVKHRTADLPVAAVLFVSTPLLC